MEELLLEWFPQLNQQINLPYFSSARTIYIYTLTLLHCSPQFRCSLDFSLLPSLHSEFMNVISAYVHAQFDFNLEIF